MRNITKQLILESSATTSGLPLYRDFISFNADNERGQIQVNYTEWLETPNGTKLELKRKMYFIRGNRFNYWFNYDVGSLPDGVTMGQLIISSINDTLLSFPNLKNGETISDIQNNDAIPSIEV
jgi:hypothetical protein